MQSYAEKLIQDGLQQAFQGNSDRAEYLLLQSYEMEQNGRILSTLGWFYGLHQGKWEEGFRYFRRAIFYNPDSGDAYNECGNLLFRAGKYRESLKWFHRSLHCPSNQKKHYVLYNLAVVYMRLNRPERSIRYLNLALRKFQDFPEAQKLLRDVRKELTRKSASESPGS